MRTVRWSARTAPARLCTVALVLAAAVSDAGAQESEYRLKAAIVSKIPAFTEWPEDSLNGRNEIDLCVVRPNPFGSFLHDLVAGETIGGRPFSIREVANVRAVAGCHLMFVTSGSKVNRAELLEQARQQHVLTVGDSPKFLDEGGIVALRLVDGRVRFDVDLSAANGAGVRLSSQLLKLALNVRGVPE